MSSTASPPPDVRRAPLPGPRGATALGGPAHPRHLPGNALRTVRVFAGTAFSVVILGDHEPDGRSAPAPRRPERRTR